MKFSIFKNGKTATGGVECTAEIFDQVTTSPAVLQLQKEINAALESGDEDLYKSKKILLPCVTWQAYFPSGHRKASEAVPSGLFMLDFDHVDLKMRALIDSCLEHREECNIVLINRTASNNGVRLVAKCREEHESIKESQQWLWEHCGAKELGVDYDKNCFDWARCDLRPHESHVVFMDYNGIFEEDAIKTFSKHMDFDDITQTDRNGQVEFIDPNEETTEETESNEELITEYKGVPMSKIAEEWLLSSGGIPEKGERNARLYKLALRIRYICDFHEPSIVAAMPHCGLRKFEVVSLVKSASKAIRSKDIPEDILDAVDRCKKSADLNVVEDYDTTEAIELTNTSKIPPLPPIFNEWFAVAPDDFKVPSVVIQLPILGTLGSRLRARYFDGELHSPSFQVSLEAPQASGKSFMRKISNYELRSIKEQDQAYREQERAYNERMKDMKVTNMKLSKSDKQEMIGNKPVFPIRYVPPTMSITQLLIRTNNANGLHLFAFAEEIDTVYKAFKRGFSSFSDALRCSFDNAEYGQDYATAESFSGIVNLYYNTLYSGTPKAMRRFYPDIEDGLVSRVFFCTLPDQFGKAYQPWREFTAREKAIVDTSLIRLEESSIIGLEVQPVHEMKMNWLASHMQQWVLSQQQVAVKVGDRTRDIFCRRAAAVGFRAGMLAFYLYGEAQVPPIRKKVMKFAEWIANLMLKQHLLRFNVKEDSKNTFQYKEVYCSLPDIFTTESLARELQAKGYDTRARQVVYRWRLAGVVEESGGKSGVYTKKGGVQ